MESIWHGVAEDFSDVPSLGEVLRVLVRMILAAGLGGILGLERARHGKAAGLQRTLVLREQVQGVVARIHQGQRQELAAGAAHGRRARQGIGRGRR